MHHKSGNVEMDKLVAENVFFSAGGRDILKGATIRAEKGSITGLLGRNGAGKSTLLQAMYGTLPVDECNVFVNGTSIKNCYSVPALVNYLPQKPFLPPWLKIGVIARQFDADISFIPDIFPELAGDVGKKVEELSGGSERLWAMLILLMKPTRFVLLDEPFTHVMPLFIDRLKELLVQVKVNKGIIITDHMYRHLLTVSDKLYLMKEGRSVYIRNQDDLVVHGYLNGFEV